MIRDERRGRGIKPDQVGPLAIIRAAASRLAFWLTAVTATMRAKPVRRPGLCFDGLPRPRPAVDRLANSTTCARKAVWLRLLRLLDCHRERAVSDPCLVDEPH